MFEKYNKILAHTVSQAKCMRISTGMKILTLIWVILLGWLKVDYTLNNILFEKNLGPNRDNFYILCYGTQSWRT